MNLRQLLYFKTIVEQGSISAASVVLHMAQPPLSQQIKSLEAHLGLTLFDRTGRSLQVTEAGQHLYRRACELLNLADEIELEMLALAQGAAGRVVIGTVTAGMLPLSRVLGPLREALPDVLFTVHQGEPQYLEQLVERREVDFAISQWPVASPALHGEPWLGLSLAAVERAPGRLAGQRRCALADLADTPLILARRKQGAGLYDRLRRSFQQAGITPRVAFECSDVNSAMTLAAEGAGTALVPLWEAGPLPPGLVQCPLDGVPAEDRLVLLWQQGRVLPGLAQRLVDACRALAEPAG